MGRFEKIILDAPPAPRAPAVLEQRSAVERELADLKLEIAETALAAYEDKFEGREKLAALDAKIRACTFQIECNAAAHELAVRIDREAVAAWKADLRADPKKAIEGITKKDCCRRCSPEHGCTITGEACAHPLKVGRINPRLQADPLTRAAYKTAREKLEMHP